MTTGPTLLAFDFDGTLAPICNDPAQARMNRAANALVQQAAQTAGLIVAIASGRDADDLGSRVDAPGAYLVGSHGLEIRGPGGVVVRDTPPLTRGIDVDLRNDIEESGMRIEMKKHAISIHWRGLDERAILPIVNRFRWWAAVSDLETIEGRCVVEARCRGGGKEEAVRWLARALGAARVIYAGDDLTDFGALQFAASNGRGLFVASEERLPPPNVTVVQSFRELFRVIREEVAI